jgi:hypothetical protein
MADETIDAPIAEPTMVAEQSGGEAPAILATPTPGESLTGETLPEPEAIQRPIRSPAGPD